MNNTHLSELWHIIGSLKGYAEAIALIDTQCDLSILHEAFVDCAARLEVIALDIKSCSSGFAAPEYAKREHNI